MNKPEQTEQQYVERITRMARDGALRSAFRGVFCGFGVIVGLAWLLMAGGTFLTYLHLGGASDDWHFLFGFGVGTLLCPGLFILGAALARILKDAESSETRPFTLMVKYHDHLVKEGLDPYEAFSSGK